MPQNVQGAVSLVEDLYVRTYRDIRILEKRLSEDTVVSLAREVLRRVATRSPGDMQPSKKELDTLCRALISDDSTAATTIINSVQAEGVSLDTLYLSYLANSARLLGEWWETDHISLVDVTIGTGRIYAIMRGLADLFPLPTSQITRSATFVSVPNETHTLGVKMAADLFRKEGWDIELNLGMTHQQIIDDIDENAPWLVGLSAAGEHALDDLAKLIVAIRVSQPSCYIMVSGHILAEAADAVMLMGVDAMTDDYASAKAEMERLWEFAVNRHLRR